MGGASGGGAGAMALGSAAAGWAEGAGGSAATTGVSITGSIGSGAVGSAGSGSGADCGGGGTSSREVNSGSGSTIVASGIEDAKRLLGARGGGNKSLPGRVTKSWPVSGWR